MLKAVNVAFDRNTIVCFCTFSSDMSHEVQYSNVLQWEFTGHMGNQSCAF